MATERTERPTIAVVDDDLLFSGMLQEFLEGEGYRVVTWSEAHGAHDLLRTEQPDLLILDVRLEQPEAGRRILEIVRQDDETGSIPVIVCSADGPFLRREHAFLSAHAVATLEKPFDLGALLAIAEAQIGRPARRGA
jgi:CheY-like chemotaxis protein